MDASAGSGTTPESENHQQLPTGFNQIDTPLLPAVRVDVRPEIRPFWDSKVYVLQPVTDRLEEEHFLHRIDRVQLPLVEDDVHEDSGTLPEGPSPAPRPAEGQGEGVVV